MFYPNLFSMTSAITNGIKVSVITEFQSEYSNFMTNKFVFTYKVTIENNSDFTIKLLRRHWRIFDSVGIITEVDGEGVVGQQPILAPGESHQYVSGCHLKSDIGKMKGTYLMERLFDDGLFEVTIPEFSLVEPSRLN